VIRQVIPSRLVPLATCSAAGIAIRTPAGGALTDGQTFSVGDGAGSSVVMEFEDQAAGNGVDGASIPVFFSGSDSAAALAARIATAISMSLSVGATAMGDTVVLPGAPLVFDAGSSPLVPLDGQGGSAPAAAGALVGPGTYYVGVYPLAGAGRQLPYALDLSGRADRAGGAVGSARDGGVLSAGRASAQFVESVSASDPSDFYHVRVAEPGDLTVRLSGLSDNADVQLFRALPRRVIRRVIRRGRRRIVRRIRGPLRIQQTAAASQDGTTPEELSRAVTAGTYYVHVRCNAGALEADYTLDVQLNTFP
jgi:hypothetical protein